MLSGYAANQAYSAADGTLYIDTYDPNNVMGVDDEFWQTLVAKIAPHTAKYDSDAGA